MTSEVYEYISILTLNKSLNDNVIINLVSHLDSYLRFMGGVGRHAQAAVHGTAQGR